MQNMNYFQMSDSEDDLSVVTLGTKVPCGK